jgi:hypothetical protein
MNIWYNHNLKKLNDIDSVQFELNKTWNLVGDSSENQSSPSSFNQDQFYEESDNDDNDNDIEIIIDEE